MRPYRPFAVTPRRSRRLMPSGRVPLILRDAVGEVTELQLMDAAGEAFATWDTTAELRYLDNAKAFIFVLDPLAWPQLRRELGSAALLGPS